MFFNTDRKKLVSSHVSFKFYKNGDSSWRRQSSSPVFSPHLKTWSTVDFPRRFFIRPKQMENPFRYSDPIKSSVNFNIEIINGFSRPYLPRFFPLRFIKFRNSLSRGGDFVSFFFVGRRSKASSLSVKLNWLSNWIWKLTEDSSLDFS